MGLVVQLQTENGVREGEMVLDPHNLLHRLLPGIDETSFQCLRFIDWYGDTYFNRPQMGQFIEELDRVRATASTPEEKVVLDQIRDLEQQCQNGVHLYVKFIGD